MNESPIYSSKSSASSLWQEYRIFADRLEFDTLFGRLTVPFGHVESAEVVESDVKGLLRGNLQLRNFRPALKLDWANFVEHVVLDKDQGWVRRLLFTPDHPREFKTVLDAALARFRTGS